MLCVSQKKGGGIDARHGGFIRPFPKKTKG